MNELKDCVLDNTLFPIKLNTLLPNGRDEVKGRKGKVEVSYSCTKPQLLKSIYLQFIYGVPTLPCGHYCSRAIRIHYK